MSISRIETYCVKVEGVALDEKDHREFRQCHFSCDVRNSDATTILVSASEPNPKTKSFSFASRLLLNFLMPCQCIALSIDHITLFSFTKKVAGKNARFFHLKFILLGEAGNTKVLPGKEAPFSWYSPAVGDRLGVFFMFSRQKKKIMFALWHSCPFS